MLNWIIASIVPFPKIRNTICEKHTKNRTRIRGYTLYALQAVDLCEKPSHAISGAANRAKSSPSNTSCQTRHTAAYRPAKVTVYSFRYRLSENVGKTDPETPGIAARQTDIIRIGYNRKSAYCGLSSLQYVVCAHHSWERQQSSMSFFGTQSLVKTISHRYDAPQNAENNDTMASNIP